MLEEPKKTQDTVVSQQRLHSIDFKNLKEVEISFEPHNITAIFGANGSGKSTILHTLTSLYEPKSSDIDRTKTYFSNFFFSSRQKLRGV